MMRIDIDITYDFRSDTPPGKDPDAYSQTLRRYHKILWSKPLPNGDMLELRDTVPGHYLYHSSAIGEFSLSSDAVIPTFKWAPQIKAMIPQIELDAFNATGYTIGGMMLWPANRIERKWTINQARGCTKLIGDRFDLTLECIRRYYLGLKSPLSSALSRYQDFFRLFQDFRGFVEFFLLHDLVSDDFAEVNIAEPFEGFRGSPIPADVRQYNAYRAASEKFIHARNRRIANLAIHAASGRTVPVA